VKIQQRVKELGLALPAAARPVGAYVPALQTGGLVFTAGQLPMADGRMPATGKVGGDVSVEQAQDAARQAVLNALAAVQAQAGSLDRVRRVVRLNVFVNSSGGFTDQAKVANGASELLVAVFGDAGRHTRCAIGVSDLPLDAPVELDLIVELSD